MTQENNESVAGVLQSILINFCLQNTTLIIQISAYIKGKYLLNCRVVVVVSCVYFWNISLSGLWQKYVQLTVSAVTAILMMTVDCLRDPGKIRGLYSATETKSTASVVINDTYYNNKTKQRYRKVSYKRTFFKWLSHL